RHDRSTLFPYTTLFRSQLVRVLGARVRGGRVQRALQHQDARQPGPLDLQRLGRPLDRPERARRVEPGVVPGLERGLGVDPFGVRSEEHTSELQSLAYLV